MTCFAIIWGTERISSKFGGIRAILFNHLSYKQTEGLELCYLSGQVIAMTIK